MKQIILPILLIFHFSLVFGQGTAEEAYNNLGVNYFGELGLRPGLEIDYGLPLMISGTPKEGKNRYLSHQIYLRPALSYYHFAHNSNNYSLSTKLNYQLRFVNNLKLRYFSIEPYIKIGYLRKSLIGEIYQTTGQGFEVKKNAGSNSFIVGGGLDFGGYLSKRFDWLIGMDYFIENTADKLILHRFVAKIGTRIKLN